MQQNATIADMKRMYLFTLEVVPLEVGKAYDALPSHLTLVSRFWSEKTPSQIAQAVEPLFGQTPPIALRFGTTTQLGPKQLTVHIVEHSPEIKIAHNGICDILDALGAEYEYPQFVREGHKPHVTQRQQVHFANGDKLITRSAYLIEVVDRKRVVRQRFLLEG